MSAPSLTTTLSAPHAAWHVSEDPYLTDPDKPARRGTKPRKIVVVSRTGPIGSKVVSHFNAQGFDADLAAPRTGCDAVTNEGVAEALHGVDVLVDVSNAPWSDVDLVAFFTASTSNLVAAAKAAGIGHYVALSVVGGDRHPDSDYLRAKATQERLVAGAGIRYSIVRATQFLDYAKVVSELATVDGQVRVPPVFLQPLGSEEVAAAVVRHALGEPIDGIAETCW